MNNVISIDLEYNFNNLRNMILFNKAKLLELANNRGVVHVVDKNVATTDRNWLNKIIENELDSILSVTITEAQLEIGIAIPHVPPSMSFVTGYVEYVKYETQGNSAVNVANFWNAPQNIKEITSDIYSLMYIPHSIYVWIAPQDSTMYGSNQLVLLNNSYAQIMACEVDHGNISKIGNHYTEKYLYSMILRNGLEDRPYIDWVRADKCYYIRNENIQANANADTLVKAINKNR